MFSCKLFGCPLSCFEQLGVRVDGVPLVASDSACASTARAPTCGNDCSSWQTQKRRGHQQPPHAWQRHNRHNDDDNERAAFSLFTRATWRTKINRNKQTPSKTAGCVKT
jgi:hypothetical protein